MDTELQPSSPTTIAQLRGLLDVTRLVGSDADLPTIFAEMARILTEALGYGTVVINLYRPAWDDFWVAAVEGTEEARRTLLGATYERAAWGDLILDPRFDRRGAYFIPAGELEWSGMGARWSPSLGSNLDPEAWQREDELFVPFRHSLGHLLGVLSLGDPVSGKRPSDEELDVLVAVAGHASLAVQSAQEAGESAQHERTLEELLRVSASIVGGHGELGQLLQTVCEGIASALRFQRVAVELVDPGTDRLIALAATGWALEDPVFGERRFADVQPLLDAEFELAGCYLLPSEAASRLGAANLTTYESENNGRGPHAWCHHWLIVPLYDSSGTPIGLIWVDDPLDLLLPSKRQLEVLRTFANQAAAAIESNASEVKLRVSEEQFRRVFEDSPLGMVLVDDQHRVLDVNDATTGMLGFKRSELVGQDVFSQTSPADVESERVMLEMLFSGTANQYAIEKQCIGKDGQLVWVNLTASAVGGDGRPQMVLRILEDVTERRRVQQELELAHEGRRNLLRRVVEVAEDERKRIAANLHDGPIQRLSAVTIRLEMAKMAGARQDWDACSAAIDDAQVNLGTEVGRLRRLMMDLRPPVLNERGLLAALGSLAASTEAESGLRVRVSGSAGDGVSIDEENETALYRIVQEALANVVQHGSATSAWIVLSAGADHLKIEIGDDGCGFDAVSPPVADGHFGLITMRERAEMAGGSLVVDSERGLGTSVRVLIPHSTHDQE
jgi:PAS domain S-box-containing protein